jgi:hypothetical protein
MISDAIKAAGLSFILGMRIPHVPYVVARWRRENPGEQIPDRQAFTQPWPIGHLLPVPPRPGSADLRRICH